MRGAIIHGILLVVILVYGYRTWTRDKTKTVNVGSVVLWDKSESDLVSIEWKSDKKIVKLERKTGDGAPYWWGTDTAIEKKPAPPKPAEPAPDAGSGAGSGSAVNGGTGSGSKTEPADAGSGSGAGSGSDAGSGSAAGSNAGSGSAADAKPPEPEMIETRKTREFPLGDAGDKLVKNYLAARALRDLGTPSADAKKNYKLDEAKTTITVTFKDGKRSFLVGGSVYGGSDRYVVDEQSGKAYVLSKELITSLEIGESSLHLTDPRGFDVNKIASVTIEANGKSKTAVRVTAGTEGQQVKTWGDPQTKKPNQTIANFIDNANNLRPTEYSATTKISSSTPEIVKLTYKDERNAVLGTLTLYKHEKAPTLPEGAQVDMTNPPKAQTEYFIMTPRTRVPAVVRKDTAERAEQDVPTVFSDNPQPSSVDPKGNPFGKVKPDMLKNNGSADQPAPMPNPHVPPEMANPHAPGGADPHGGGAPAPTPAPDVGPHGEPVSPPADKAAPAPKKAAPAPAPKKEAPKETAPAPTPAPAPAPTEQPAPATP